jgi:hypothetical protein
LFGCLLVTVQGQIFHGRRTCSTIISKHSIEMREGLHNWDNKSLVESVNVFLVVCLYELNLWMFSLLFACMNGLYECFLNRWCKWMESVNVFFHFLLTWIEYGNMFTICLCKWNLCMPFLWFIYMNALCDCFLYGLFF